MCNYDLYFNYPQIVRISRDLNVHRVSLCMTLSLSVMGYLCVTMYLHFNSIIWTSLSWHSVDAIMSEHLVIKC